MEKKGLYNYEHKNDKESGVWHESGPTEEK